MTGAEFAAEGHRLALAYARLRPDGPAWLEAWQADDIKAADDLMEWELEGHPFTFTFNPTWRPTMKTVIEVLDGMLAIYTTPGTWTRAGIAKDSAGRPVAADSSEAVAWSLEGALERVIGDWEDPVVEHAENMRRQVLLSDVFHACGFDLMAFNDAARHQDRVTRMLRSSQKRVHALT